MKRWMYILTPPLIFLLVQFLVNKALGLLTIESSMASALGSCIVLPLTVFFAYREKLNLRFLGVGIGVLVLLLIVVTKFTDTSLILLLGIGVAGPINEELIYRGIMLERSKRELGFVFAMILSSALFAVVHGELLQIALAFLLGCLFGLIIRKFKNVTFTSVLHSVINILLFYLLR